MRALNQGTNGWYETLPAPAASARLAGAHQFEWVIVGAGCCGLATAHRLAELRPDDRIALIEAQRVGYGSSGRNSGFMIDAHIHGLDTDVDRLRDHFTLWTAGLQWLRETVQHYQIQCDWSDWGRLYAAVDAGGIAHLSALQRHFAATGIVAEALGAEQMRDATGSTYYRAGAFLSGSSLVQPAALMRGLAQVMPPNVQLFEDSPMDSLAREGALWCARAAEGEARAPTVILSAGIATPAFGALKSRLVPLSLYASLTRPLTSAERAVFAGIDELGILPTSANGSTIRLTRDDRILMRNTTRYSRYQGNDVDDLAEITAIHSAAIARRWPSLADVPLDHTWSGVMAVTRNGGSLFGEFQPRLFAVGTSDVSPVTRGVTAGRAIAELAVGKTPEPGGLLDVQQRLSPASWVPPDPILGWVARRRLHRIERDESAEL